MGNYPFSPFVSVGDLTVHYWSTLLDSKQSYKVIRILLMCVLRAHIKFSVLGNIFSRIEKIMTAFSISEKMFSKTESLICVLRTHINRTQVIKWSTSTWTTLLVLTVQSEKRKQKLLSALLATLLVLMTSLGINSNNSSCR